MACRIELAERLAPDFESTIYRLVQEALTNVVKHARAEHVWIAVVESSGSVDVEVCDDGVGMDSDSASAGFGLQGMRERVALAGGALTIEAAEPGTRVRAMLPAKRPTGIATSTSQTGAG